jgi:hypothetical protein
VVIDYFDVLRSGVRPYEADAPLRVDADAVLAGAVARQRLQAIPWWREQIAQLDRVIQHLQLALRHAFDAAKPPRMFARVDRLGVGTPEGTYRHAAMYIDVDLTSSVKRGAMVCSSRLRIYRRLASADFSPMVLLLLIGLAGFLLITLFDFLSPVIDKKFSSIFETGGVVDGGE